MSPKVGKCERCFKRYRGSGEWNVTARAGVVVGLRCPACQTPEENAEALVKEATLVYGRLPDGRVITRPRA